MTIPVTNDPALLARFWTQALGYQSAGAADGDAQPIWFQ